MAAILDPPRSLAPISISDPRSLVTADWLLWFIELYQICVAGTQTAGTPLILTDQSGTVPLGPLTLPSLQNGRYRISWFMQITVPDGVASSVALTISFQHNGQVLAKTFPALTGDTVVTFAEDDLFVLIDQNSAILYSVAYSSTTPNKMKYELCITVESV